MLIRDFLNFLLDDSLEDARSSLLALPSGLLEFRGAELAVQECRDCLMGDRMAVSMELLLHEARKASAVAQADDWPDKAFWFAREVQVEWIADVVSVILLQRRMPTIVPPTRGAALAAVRLSGALPARD